MHFLIIDDDTVARNVLKNHLKTMYPDCKISEAPNGAQGLFYFFKKNPDLLFLDMLMPLVDGRTVLDVVHECYRCGKIVKKPKIVLCSMLETRQIDQMHPLNDKSLVGAVVKKPITRNKLRVIEELLAQ
ncbi:response regulator [Thiovibrio sp. JS02]